MPNSPSISGLLRGCYTHRHYPEYVWHNHEQIELDGTTYAHRLIIQHAMNFIRKHQRGPFFCYVPVTIPHAALEVPNESKQPFRQKFAESESVVGAYAGATYTNPAAALPPWLRNSTTTSAVSPNCYDN